MRSAQACRQALPPFTPSDLIRMNVSRTRFSWPLSDKHLKSQYSHLPTTLQGGTASTGDCLIFGDNLDCRARYARRCGRNLATREYTDIIIALKRIPHAAAAVAGSGIFDVQIERQGLVSDNSRPGDVSFDYNGANVAIDAYTVDTSATSNIGTDVDKLLDAEKFVKEK